MSVVSVYPSKNLKEGIFKSGAAAMVGLGGDKNCVVPACPMMSQRSMQGLAALYSGF